MSGDMIGRVIKGRYKLIDELGRGSFATVYIARDTKNNRIYAVKVMHIEFWRATGTFSTGGAYPLASQRSPYRANF